ncbi:MAG TPA: heparinase II/III family protein [Tepidisphaeraceae bacterium]|jgi:hypothetical protein
MNNRNFLWILLSLVVVVAGRDAQGAGRELKYPVKTKRTLWSAEEIATARENVKKYPAAKKIADDVVKAADYWVDWSDEELVGLVTDSRVPRAFETGTGGCPKCGHKLYEKYTQYGWTIDPKLPFKVKCPIDGSVYPSNDYGNFYKSNFKEKKGWETEFVDDGWGWKNPKDGEKYWFVAYWNHWMWHKHLTPGVRTLGRAYLLTGDQKYAHKAIVLLHRIAEVYPAMDHENQSRYGEMMKARGAHYPGKVVNAIWETGLAENVTEAYDDVWDAIDSDESAQKLFKKSGEEIRKFIEANFLEDAIEAVFSAKIRGNFGMHQNTLVYLGIVRQFGETDKWFNELLNRSTDNRGVLGLNYALYNLISRDGFPDENAPGYNIIWVSKIAEYGELLSRMGRDVFAYPKTKRLFDAPIDQVVMGLKTPTIGDTGNVYGGLTGQNAEVYQTGYRHYRDERYVRWLGQMGAVGEKGFKSFESLIHPAIEAAKGGGERALTLPSPGVPGEGRSGGNTVAPQKSRLMDGYGQAILNNAKDSVALSMFYGLHFGHGHFDRMNIEVFGGGESLVPDLGYPDAMNEFVKGIYSWSKNTISHNTVTVDAQRQVGNVPGEVKLFADGKWARVVDVDAAGTYPQCSQYRRAVVMVDVGEGRSYFVDFFNVKGGGQHDYSLHGPPGTFTIKGGKWGEPQRKGTLAGENVELGYLYDRPEMEAKGYAGGYSSYAGSGFQHLYNVTKLEGGAGEWVADYSHEKNEKARVRIRVMDQPGQEVMLCDARVSPVKYPQILKYIIARKNGSGVASAFVSVIEPYADRPVIKSVKREGETVTVELEDGQKDVIAYEPEASRVTVRRGEKTWSAVREKTGSVASVDPAKSIVKIAAGKGASLEGRVVHFSNPLHRTAHPVVSSRIVGDEVELTLKDDVLVGKVRIDALEPAAVVTGTALSFSPAYRGAWLCTSDYQGYQRIAGVEGGRIVLEEKLPADHPFKVGQDAWIVDVGPGDGVESAAVSEKGE